VSVEEVGLLEELVAAAELGPPQEPGLVGEVVAAPEEAGLVDAGVMNGLVAADELGALEEVVKAQIQRLCRFGAQLAGDSGPRCVP